MPAVVDLPGYKPHKIRVLFTCGACKARCNLAAVEVRFDVQITDRAFGTTRKVRYYNLVDAPAACKPRLSDRGFEAGMLTLEACGKCGATRLPSGRNAVLGRQMTIRLKPDHKCGAACLNAKGSDCECSCGGLHHGEGFPMTVAVSAVDAPCTTCSKPASAHDGAAIDADCPPETYAAPDDT